MQTYPQPVVQRLRASGGGAAVSLLEVQTVALNRYCWSDIPIVAPSVLQSPAGSLVPGVYIPGEPSTPGSPSAQFTRPSGGGSNPAGIVTEIFSNWIAKAPQITTYKSTQTAAASFVIQNVSGNSIYRAAGQIFSKVEMMNSLVFYRLWMPDLDFPLVSLQGTIGDVSILADGSGATPATMSLAVKGFCRWSEIDAPNRQITSSCQNVFAAMECGSTAPTPCNNDYGSCTSPNRFCGCLQEWVGATLSTGQSVQPEPLRVYNGRKRA